MSIQANASFQDVLDSAGVKEDVRGRYPAKPYRTCNHMAALFGAMDSALRAKDKEISRLQNQYSKIADEKAALATRLSVKVEENSDLKMDKVRLGLEYLPSVTAIDRQRICG